MTVAGLLVIIPCGKAKIWDKGFKGPCPAESAYTGAPFQVNKNYARTFAQHWLILSAKYGFMEPTFNIPEAYNITFKDKKTKPITPRELKSQAEKLSLPKFRIVVVLGGKEYRQVVAEAFEGHNVELVFPFAGLPVGKMMSATKRAMALGKPFE